MTGVQTCALPILSMPSRGQGKAKNTTSKKISNPMDRMSVGAASSKGPGIPGLKCGGKAKGYKSGGVVDGTLLIR